MKTFHHLILFIPAVALIFSTGCTKETVVTEGSAESHFVDLGLSVKWADANIGASQPQDCGNYYAFGELDPKSEYSYNNYKWADPEKDSYSKYFGTADGDELENTDDVAFTTLGNGYRMPTAEEWDELLTYCTWTFSTYKGTAGYKVESLINGQYIFLPAAGLFEEKDGAITGTQGYYLSRSCSDTGPYRLSFAPQGADIAVTSTRFYGFSIRAVATKPEPVKSELTIFSNNSYIYEFICKENARNRKIYIEAYNGEAGNGYNPAILCLDPAGKTLWGWKQLSERKSKTSANWTMFDVTPDGSVIDCYNALNGYNEAIEDDYNDPFVTKVSASGEFLWGDKTTHDILLHEFRGDFASVSPIGSFVASDNAGGAWIAAWNEPEPGTEDDVFSQMVISHLNSDGEKVCSDILLDNHSGSSGYTCLVTRAQMFSDNTGKLYALILYETVSGISEGYYDILVISPDGKILSRENLMPRKAILGEIRANITPDTKGGAYVTAAAVGDDDITHLWLSHFDRDGKVDAKDVNLTPDGCTSSIKTRQVIDSKTNNLAVISMDRYPLGGSVYDMHIRFNLVDEKGTKVVSDNGNPVELVSSTGRNSISRFELKALYNPEREKIFVSYIYEGYMMTPELRAIYVGFDGKAGAESTIARIDRTFYNIFGDEDQVYDFIDGKLIYFFRPNASKRETKDFYGYIYNVD